MAPSETLSLDSWADDLNAIMTACGLDSAILLGHSMGGAIALQFALKYPNRRALWWEG